MREVLIPASGFAMTEALLVRWYKQPGDHVVTGEALAEIETDKVTADLESPATGRLGPLLAAEGTMVPVGAPLTHILDELGTPESRTDEPSVVVPSPAPALLPPGRRDATDGDGRAAATSTLVAPASIEPATTADHLEWLETMLLIREFEGRLDPLALAGKIPGGVHLSIGQEAVAVGVVRALRPGDLVAGTHRSHHHALALGIEPRRIMAELLGKAPGTNRGRGGSMHVADLTRGYLGGNGIVGAGIGIAMGAALAAAYADRDQAVVGFVGDGGVNTGRTWESANLAAVWRLPLVIVCENNLYAVETATASVTAAASIAERASAFGLHAVVVDGQDVEAVHEAARSARDRAVRGGGPTFIEARTYRYEGHNTGQVIRYRTAEELDDWRTNRDPIKRLQGSLAAIGALDERASEAMADRVRAVVDEAVAFAEASPWPDAAAAMDGVTSMSLGVRTNP